MTALDRIDAQLRRWGGWALACGLLGLALCAVLWFLDRTQFIRSYLVGYAVWWTVSVGCLGMTFLGHLVTGRWAQIARPFLECGIAAIPLLAILWLPFIVGLDRLYPWANPSLVEADPILAHRAPWLNANFFLGRAAFYFAVWLVMGFALLSWSRRANGNGGPPRAPGDVRSPRHVRLGSALGLVFFMSTVTFAAFDWLMSLDPHWYSTAFGAIVVLGGAVAALSVTAGAMASLEVWPSIAGLSPDRLRNDIGTLLLAFVMLWAYLSFSQYLIIWSADQPIEIAWYLDRVTGAWGALAVGLIVLHFALPFLALLSRDIKQDPRWLGTIAGLLIVMHVVDVYWTIVPTYAHEEIAAHWGDVAAIAGVGGLWFAVFGWNLRRRLPPALAALERVNGSQHAAHGDESEAEHG